MDSFNLPLSRILIHDLNLATILFDAIDSLRIMSLSKKIDANIFRNMEIDSFPIPFYFTAMQIRMDLERKQVGKTSKDLGMCRNKRWDLALRLIPESRHQVKCTSLGS